MKELSENEIQRAVFKHLRARGSPGVFAFHPKNASSDMRGRRRGIYAGLGIEPGVPDVIVFKAWEYERLPHTHKNGSLSWCDVYALELKRTVLRGKKLTEHDEKQRECRDRLNRVGVIEGIAYGLDEALAWLEERGILRGKTS